MENYVLDDQNNAVPVSFEEWLHHPRHHVRVAATGEEGDGKVFVSTMFLGLNHRYHGDGPPLVFETMIFGGEHDQWQERCSTWAEAEAMHARACQLAGLTH